YKLRTHIAKHLKSRSEAIRTALKAFNAAAHSLNPKHMKIEFTDIVKWSFLAEFDLLRDARQDVRSKHWAQPSKRVLTDQFYRYEHAKEEIRCLNVEKARLEAWIESEDQLYEMTVQELSTTDSCLSYEIRERGSCQKVVNDQIRLHLHQVESLIGYTGPQSQLERQNNGDGSDGGQSSNDLSDEDISLVFDGVDRALSAVE
ncbi:hypothetical protein FRC02_002732, partial [Tulasnella sp. 418]